MQLSEKEIAKLIMAQQWGCEGAIWKGLPLEVVQEWGETISYWLEIANMRAAHTIAEKLREGVVWESSGPAKSYWHEQDFRNTVYIWDENDENATVMIDCAEDDKRPLCADGFAQGARFTVTVTKEG